MEREHQGFERPNSLRIEVVGDKTISPQARRYAEYRVFAALIRCAAARSTRFARVVLRRLHPRAGSGEVACAVTVLSECESVRVRAIADHPYAAINRAVERLDTATEHSSAERIVF